MGVCGYSVPKRNKGQWGHWGTYGPPTRAKGPPGWRQNKKGLWGFDPPRTTYPLERPGRHPGTKHGSGALIKIPSSILIGWGLPNITRTMRTGSDSGLWLRANKSNRSDFLDGKQQIWASPQQFLLISSRSRCKLPGWSLLKKDYCPALRILGVLGDPVPETRYTEGVVVNSRSG